MSGQCPEILPEPIGSEDRHTALSQPVSEIMRKAVCIRGGPLSHVEAGHDFGARFNPRPDPTFPLFAPDLGVQLIDLNMLQSQIMEVVVMQQLGLLASAGQPAHDGFFFMAKYPDQGCNCDAFSEQTQDDLNAFHRGFQVVQDRFASRRKAVTTSLAPQPLDVIGRSALPITNQRMQTGISDTHLFTSGLGAGKSLCINDLLASPTAFPFAPGLHGSGRFHIHLAHFDPRLTTGALFRTLGFQAPFPLLFIALLIGLPPPFDGFSMPLLDDDRHQDRDDHPEPPLSLTLHSCSSIVGLLILLRKLTD
jgi:hypothetical protein